MDVCAPDDYPPATKVAVPAPAKAEIEADGPTPVLSFNPNGDSSVSTMPPWFRTALHVAYSGFWKATRLLLMLWGILNGFGIGLLGQVARVKQRVSRRVARISGSIST